MCLLLINAVPRGDYLIGTNLWNIRGKAMEIIFFLVHEETEAKKGRINFF